MFQLHPLLETWPTIPGARLRIRLVTLGFAGQHSIHWATPARADVPSSDLYLSVHLKLSIMSMPARRGMKRAGGGSRERKGKGTEKETQGWTEDGEEGRGPCQTSGSGWAAQVLLANSLLQALPPHLVGITSPEMDFGSWLRQQRGLAAWGLHLGQPLLHAADVVVQPPGAADLGQTVFLVGQQGALQNIRGPGNCLQLPKFLVLRSVEKRGPVPWC